MTNLKTSCAAALLMASGAALADGQSSTQPLSASGMSAEEMGRTLVKPLIVDGVPVPDISKAAHQVALVWNDTRDQYCGGTIIADKWILTAAHCVDLRFSGLLDADDLDVVTGTLTFLSGGHKADVKAIFLHPDWDRGTLNFDAALLELAAPVQSGVSAAVHGQGDTLTTGESLRVSGWGAISEGGPTSTILMRADVPYVQNATCNSPDSYKGRVTDVMMCAGFRDGGRDACQGDSGGPIVGHVDGVTTLVGIVSWGDGCARRLKYGIYTRVAAISDWVANTITAK